MTIRIVMARVVARALPPLRCAGSGRRSCPPDVGGSQPTQRQDACQKAVDLFQYMAPQLGLAIAGGNATLGQGGTLGGFGHFSVGLRGNAFSGDCPSVRTSTRRSGATHGAALRTTSPRRRQFIPLPAADAAIGIFKGVPLGADERRRRRSCSSARPTCPSSTSERRASRHAGRLAEVGYGARVGLLQESLVVPGVSFTLPASATSRTTTHRRPRRRRRSIDISGRRSRSEDDGVARRSQQEPARSSASLPASARTAYEPSATSRARRRRRRGVSSAVVRSIEQKIDPDELFRRPVAQPAAAQAHRRSWQVSGGDGRRRTTHFDGTQPTSRARTARWDSASASST